MTQQYTDTQLKQTLAKMLPDRLVWYSNELCWQTNVFTTSNQLPSSILDTELLHLCWLVEETLMTWTERNNYYYSELWRNCGGSIDGIAHATWQQRTIALAKVKGIEVV